MLCLSVNTKMGTRSFSCSALGLVSDKEGAGGPHPFHVVTACQRVYPNFRCAFATKTTYRIHPPQTSSRPALYLCALPILLLIFVADVGTNYIFFFSFSEI